jgi:16S rRNA (guanine527-N7)-methyltransferase
MIGETEPLASAGTRLNALLGTADLSPLDAGTTARFEAYLALLQRWNAKINLTAIRDEEGILARHFVESIACARALPPEVASLLDYGSGAGFPGLPIALCRPTIAVTLAERQTKKAAFLQEAVRTLSLGAKVYGGDASALTDRFDCVTLRAVERMSEAVAGAVRLLRPGGWLAVLTSRRELEAIRAAAGTGLLWQEAQRLPGDERLLVIGATTGSESARGEEPEKHRS